MELNDAGLLVGLYDGRKQHLADLGESPAVAYINGKEHCVGQSAESRVVISPKNVTDRYWERFSKHACNIPGYEHVTYGAFAKLHLQTIIQALKPKPSRLAVALQGGFEKEQAELLADLLPTLQITFSGLFDLATAAAYGFYTVHRPEHRSALVIDTSQHATYVTMINCADGRLARTATFGATTGFATIYSRIIPVVCQEFLATTRFALRENAESLQSVHNGMRPFLMDLVHRPSATFRAQHGATELKADISLYRLEREINEELASIVSLVDQAYAQGGSPQKHILLTERAARVPGLHKALERARPGRTHILQRGAAAGAVAQFNTTAIDSPDVDSCVRASFPYDFVEKIEPPQGPPPEPSRGDLGPNASAIISSASVERSETSFPLVPQEIPNAALANNLAYPIVMPHTLLGRQMPANGKGIKLENVPGLSREHCRLEWRGRNLFVVNLSHYGTTVNGTVVEGDRQLSTGDLLNLGGSCPVQLIHLMP